MRGGGSFVVIVMAEEAWSPGLVGEARCSSKLSLKTGASLQNNQNKATLKSNGPSPGVSKCGGRLQPRQRSRGLMLLHSGMWGAVGKEVRGRGEGRAECRERAVAR